MRGLIVGLGMLLPLSAWADDMAGMAMSTEASPTVKGELTAAGELVAGRPVSLTLILKDQYGRPLRPDDLQVIHTQPVHLFLVDGGLTDYAHMHPMPGSKDGEWLAGFTPQKNAYKAWVEVQPKGGVDQFIPLQLGSVVAKPGVLGKDNMLTATVDGLHFTLMLAMPPQVGMGTLAIMNIYDDQGVPVTSLEPIMGAYAHLVGVDATLDSVMHVHPSGAEPNGPDSRGGPVLNFQLMPKVAGMHRLFLQVKNQGQVITVPFTIQVNGN